MTFSETSSTERLYNPKKEQYQTLEVCIKKLKKILIFPVIMTLKLKIYIRLFQNSFLVLLFAGDLNIA